MLRGCKSLTMVAGSWRKPQPFFVCVLLWAFMSEKDRTWVPSYRVPWSPTTWRNFIGQPLRICHSFGLYIHLEQCEHAWRTSNALFIGFILFYMWRIMHGGPRYLSKGYLEDHYPWCVVFYFLVGMTVSCPFFSNKIFLIWFWQIKY